MDFCDKNRYFDLKTPPYGQNNKKKKKSSPEGLKKLIINRTHFEFFILDNPSKYYNGNRKKTHIEGVFEDLISLAWL